MGSANTNALYFTRRLLDNLDELWKYPLTVIEAPMGYGKTVAVREYLSRRSVDVIWLTLTGRSGAAFWRDFCQALAAQFPHYAELAQSLLRLGSPVDLVCAREARRLMLQMEFDRETVLVIDDYHLSNTPEVGRFIELLAREVAPHLRGVLISRDVYKGNRELMRLKGYLHIIGSEAFVLTEEEIPRYFASCGVFIGTQEAALLYRHTEGWMAALYLYLLRYIKDGQILPPGNIYALIEQEVYEPLSHRLRAFLFALCPLGRFSFEQADFVWGRGGTAELLRELRARNAFLSFDEKEKIFSLHSLFLKFLTKQFERLPEETRRLHSRRCGDWFMENSRWFPAVEAFVAAGDFERALLALEADQGDCMIAERRTFFLSLFRTCPAEILERHLAAGFLFALFLYTVGDFPAFAEYCGWLRTLLERLPENDPDANLLRGELEFLGSFMCFNDIEAMSGCHRRAYALIGGPLRMFATDAPWTLGSPSVLYMFHRESGQLARELELMRDCMPYYYRLAGGHGAGGETLMAAEAAFNAFDFENAEIFSHKAEAQARQKGQLGNVICGLFLRMRLSLAEGDFAQADALLHRARELITIERDYYLLHTVDLCEGFLYAALGYLPQVPDWLKTGELAESRLFSFSYGIYYMIFGRVLLLSRQFKKLLGLGEVLLAGEDFRQHVLFSVYGHIYMACAYFHLAREESAFAALRRALALALPDRLLMPFVENGDLLRPMLERLCGEYGPELEEILRQTDFWQKNRRKIMVEHFLTTGSLLTARELEIARLAGEGLSNKEIAERLFIAPSTVKRALVVIYGKLGLNGREELPDVL